MRLVIKSAHCLSLRVCAQGADRHAQLEQLATMGCDAVQGHLLGGPVEVELLDTRTRYARRLVVPMRAGTGGRTLSISSPSSAASAARSRGA